MLARGFWPDGSFDPIGVLEVLARPRVHRVVWFTVWSASVATAVSLLLGLPAAPPCTGWSSAAGNWSARPWCRSCCRPSWWGSRSASCSASRDHSASWAWTGRRWRSSPACLLQRRRIRAVGAAWASLDPRPGEAAAALGASPFQVFRTVTLPALRPAIVSSASVVFLFCATSFGVVLTLAGCGTPRSRPRSYLLTTNLLDLQAAAALSLLQLVAITGLLVIAGRLRAVPDPSVARAMSALAARDAVTGRRSPPRSCCSSRWRRRSRHWSPARCRSATAGEPRTTVR